METKIKLGTVVSKVIESMLECGNKDKCLLITVTLRKDNFKKDTFELKTFNIIAYRPSSYTYIGSNDGYFHHNTESELKKHSYHSSCWRYDGVESCIKEYQDSLDEITKISDEQYVNIETIKLLDGYVNSDGTKFIPIIPSNL